MRGLRFIIEGENVLMCLVIPMYYLRDVSPMEFNFLRLSNKMVDKTYSRYRWYS